MDASTESRASGGVGRRWPSLGLLVVVLVVILVTAGGLFAWKAQRQLSLFQEIDAAGGGVATEPIGPDWLREWVGPERLRAIERPLDLHLPNAELLGRIEDGSQVTGINLQSAAVTGDGLKHLAEFSNLEWLILESTKITDQGL